MTRPAGVAREPEDVDARVKLGYGRTEHQASHKIWGTAIDDSGKYQAIELE